MIAAGAKHERYHGTKTDAYRIVRLMLKNRPVHSANPGRACARYKVGRHSRGERGMRTTGRDAGQAR